MQGILDGAVKFMEEDFLEHKELFESLGEKQTPHTLFVGCIDSRVVPSLITNTVPGDLVVVRNIANIVPPYRKSEEFLATTSAIEYALQTLNVQNVIVSNSHGVNFQGDCLMIKDPPGVSNSNGVNFNPR